MVANELGKAKSTFSACLIQNINLILGFNFRANQSYAVIYMGVATLNVCHRVSKFFLAFVCYVTQGIVGTAGWGKRLQRGEPTICILLIRNSDHRLATKEGAENCVDQ